MYECFKTMHKAFIFCWLFIKTINIEKVIGFIRTLVGYESPGSWSMTLFLTVAMGDSRNAWKRVTSLIRGTFYVNSTNWNSGFNLMEKKVSFFQDVLHTEMWLSDYWRSCPGGSSAPTLQKSVLWWGSTAIM